MPGQLPLSTGKGVILAALTTTVGFGALMISHHRGIFSLGFIAFTGSLCVLAAAISVLPAILARMSQPGAVPERRYRKMTNRLFVLLLLVLGGFFGFAGKGAAAEPATGQVKMVLDRAMDIQTRSDLAGDTNRKERARLIRQLISENFALSDMAREALKESWDKVSQKQRSDFQGLFTELFQDSYTRMVLNFLARETIEYRGESPDEKGAMVKTVIMRANEHIPVDYHLMQKSSRWLIRDVDIDEVSIMENYRSSFRRALQAGSFDALLQKMRTQSQASRD